MLCSQRMGNGSDGVQARLCFLGEESSPRLIKLTVPEPRVGFNFKEFIRLETEYHFKDNFPTKTIFLL